MINLPRLAGLLHHLPDARDLRILGADNVPQALPWQAVEVYAAVPELVDIARENTAAALDLTMGAIPVDKLRCPLCGATVKWSCGTTDYPTGRAHCEMGGNVSRRVGSGPVCMWRGTKLVRVAGEVVAPLPISHGLHGDGPKSEGEADIRLALRLPASTPWPDVLARARSLAERDPGRTLDDEGLGGGDGGGR